MNSEPQVTVITPVRDDAARLRLLLDGLAAQTLPANQFEVVVVANACRDDSAAVARAWGAKVIEEPRPNRARARNAGIAAARGDLLAFIDADCVPEPDWLAALLRCAGSAPLVAGPVTVTAGEPPNAIERFDSLWRFQQEHWVRLGWAATANLLVERRAIEAVGGFDVAYRHIAEDADLCVRAAAAGFALGFCPDAQVRHPAEYRFRPMLRRAFWHGYSSAQAASRVGVGERAWRRPWVAIRGRAALAAIGRRGFTDPREDRRMAALARASYAMRIAGSLFWEIRRAT